MGVNMTAWGMELQLDLYLCNPDTIRDEGLIREFTTLLCDLIGMKRFGECQVVNFGEDERVAGYSMTQLIETSLISAHFANQSNSIYLNVFSCKEFDYKIVEEFATSFFEAESSIARMSDRI